MKRLTLLLVTLLAIGFQADLNFIDVSEVTRMIQLFGREETRQFNGDISKWNVGNVKSMKGMFDYSLFNGNISSWNVSNVVKHDDFASLCKLE